MLVFGSQIQLILDLVVRLRRVVPRAYLCPRLTGHPTDAPVNELVLYQWLLQYKTVNMEIAAAALLVIR